MNELTTVRIRIDLARGHWSLGEREPAIVCLERAASEAPRLPELLKLVDEMLLEGPDPRLEALRPPAAPVAGDEDDAPVVVPADRSPLATSTLAQLLAEQGHTDRALEVAAEVLRRNPDDARASEVYRRLSGEPPAGAVRDDASSTDTARRLEILEQLLARIRMRGARARHHDLS